MDKFVEDIFNLFIKILPSDWGKIVLHATINPNNHSLYFFVQDKMNKNYYSYVDMQKMGIFSKQEFQDIADHIGQLSRSYQNTFEKKWIGYTLEITSDGKTNMNFEYKLQSMLDMSNWKDTYLK